MNRYVQGMKKESEKGLGLYNTLPKTSQSSMNKKKEKKNNKGRSVKHKRRNFNQKQEKRNKNKYFCHCKFDVFHSFNSLQSNYYFDYSIIQSDKKES